MSGEGAQAGRSSDPGGEPEACGDPIGRAERAAAALSSGAHPRGGLGPRFDRGSPFFVGMAAAAGVCTTVAAVLAFASGGVCPDPDRGGVLSCAGPETPCPVGHGAPCSALGRGDHGIRLRWRGRSGVGGGSGSAADQAGVAAGRRGPALPLPAHRSLVVDCFGRCWMGDEPADHGLGRCRGGFPRTPAANQRHICWCSGPARPMGGLPAVHDRARRDPDATPRGRWPAVPSGSRSRRYGSCVGGKSFTCDGGGSTPRSQCPPARSATTAAGPNLVALRVSECRILLSG